MDPFQPGNGVPAPTASRTIRTGAVGPRAVSGRAEADQSFFRHPLPNDGPSRNDRLLLVSTERYRASRNTARAPVAHPFYAVYDISGRELFRLPTEASSGTFIFAMGVDPATRSAVFGFGGVIDVCNAEEDYETPAFVKEVMMRAFGLTEHWFDFHQWPENRHGC